ncbi:MAG: tRNA epoxyqueuosine(34) reductase QueG [Nitrosomonadales bacterium]|nr:tRNA epoxyqueuosine(34) reductase QueG [Nitrosomonadales bacterium]
MEQRAHQRGLARTQVAAQMNHHACLERACQPCGEGRGSGLIGQQQGYCELPPCGGMPAYPTSAIIRLMQMETSQTDYAALAANIKEWGRALGFQAVGISDTVLDDAEARLLEWLARGNHGEMDYMAKHGAKRSRPAELVPGTLRVISLRMDYYPANAKDGWEVLQNGSRAFISRYALGRDYHKVLRNRLEKLAEKIRAAVGDFSYRVFTDSAPVMEVELANKAHLGWRGKHTLLLSRKHGSYFFLGELYTDLPLPIDVPGKKDTLEENHCGTCKRCIEVCPTQAIVAPYELDARRCISYLTIEFKGSIPLELRPLIGNRIYGCDDCQLVCPWNRFAHKSVEADFVARHRLDDVALTELFAWEETTFKEKLAGSAIHRIGHEQWLRNIAVALGNAPRSAEVLAALQTRAQHASPLVREHVAWALEQQRILPIVSKNADSV